MKQVEAVPDMWTSRGLLWKPRRGRGRYTEVLRVDDLASGNLLTRGLHIELEERFTRLRAHFSGAVIERSLCNEGG